MSDTPADAVTAMLAKLAAWVEKHPEPPSFRIIYPGEMPPSPRRPAYADGRFDPYQA
jgi:hypothetical protein